MGACLRTWVVHAFSPFFATLSSVNPPPLLAVAPLLLLPLAQGCVEVVPSPFQPDASPDSQADVSPESSADAPLDTTDADVDSSLGGPCLDDDQCDDAIDCTFDLCDPDAKRCRHEPNHLTCQDERYCNGSEVCDPLVGCSPGEPVTCSDIDPCTIDRCVEDTKDCARDPRDADGDDDPDWHCSGGDCNDGDPLVSSLAMEICGNGRDEDCDGEADEEDCGYPANDTCSDPLTLPVGQTVVASLFGAKPDYAASCIPSAGLRDIVAAVAVPNDAAYDLDVLVLGDQGLVFAAAASECGDPATETACGPGAYGPLGPVARFIARQVTTGMTPIYIASDIEQKLQVRASLLPSQPPPSNETCGTAIDLTPGEPTLATLVGVDKDLGSNCSSTMGDLVYRITTEAPHDIYVFGGSVDGLGDPVLSFRNENCAKPEDEIACKSASAPVLFARDMPAGTYFVAVSATAPTSVQLRVELEAPSSPPDGDTCEDAPPITPNTTEPIALQGHMNDLADTCLLNAPDAVRTLTLTEPSDVLLLGNISSADEGAVSLWLPDCGPTDMLACANTAPSPVRVAIPNLPEGEYRAVIESRNANPTQLTAFTRPATPPTLVAFADTCDEAHAIPLQGGLFQGNTSNASSQYVAGCDQAGGATQGAADQMLRLDLPGPRRVLFDMRGSTYRTLLNIRKGPACPGAEVPGACSVGFYQQRSFLDLDLEAGTYFVQVDGFFGESGAWFLDVYVVE